MLWLQSIASGKPECFTSRPRVGASGRAAAFGAPSCRQCGAAVAVVVPGAVERRLRKWVGQSRSAPPCGVRCRLPWQPVAAAKKAARKAPFKKAPKKAPAKKAVKKAHAKKGKKK